MNFSSYWRKQTGLGYSLAQSAAQRTQQSVPDAPRAARKNILHAAGLVLLFNISVLFALIAGSLWPLLFGILFFASLVQRSALRNRNPSLRIRDRLLYGVQTNLNQVPILIGQLNYRTRRSKR